MSPHNHWPWDYLTAAKRVERIKDAALFMGDCLEVMRGLPDASVDMILCDLTITPTGESHYGDSPAEWIPDALLLNLEDGETYSNFSCEEIK